MPVTCNVNMMTVVHAGSTGMAISFPDVCKTPTPAGPIPIPYPNIAQSSDTAEGSKTVKVDGNPIMLKSSNFRMSTGDEAGSAMGVMSNKIKGKACPLNASFDVKMDGKNVFRLTDPMKTNCQSQNAVNPAELQMPIPQIPDMPEECQKLKEEEKKGEEIASKKSGMISDHFNAMKKIAKQEEVVLYIRQTSELCKPWIEEKHQPKPHKIFKGNTIKGDRVAMAQKWLSTIDPALDGWNDEEARTADLTQSDLLKSDVAYARDAREFKGVIGATRPNNMAEPLKAIEPFKQDGIEAAGSTYEGKWMTADYDLYQVLSSKDMCAEVDQKGQAFSRLKVAINKACKWDAIQHGPQAQWIANDEDVKLGAPPNVNFPQKMKDGFSKKEGGFNETVEIKGRKGMKVFDEDVTVIAPGGVLYLEKREDTFDALKCRDCDKK